jgi:hypothetical protein
MAGAFAAFALVVAIFSKLFPVVSIWEVAEQYEEQPRGATAVLDRPTQASSSGEGPVRPEANPAPASGDGA